MIKIVILKMAPKKKKITFIRKAKLILIGETEQKAEIKIILSLIKIYIL